MKPLPRRTKRNELTPEVRHILSGGMDFFSELDHLTPVPKDKWGKIQDNLWTYVPGYFKPTPYDAPTDEPDGRIDFLSEEWEKHKDEVLAWHLAKHHDGSRPWAWWMWDAPEGYPPREDDELGGSERRRLQAIAVLLRHNLLSREEQDAIREQASKREALSARGPDDGALEVEKR